MGPQLPRMCPWKCILKSEEEGLPWGETASLGPGQSLSLWEAPGRRHPVAMGSADGLIGLVVDLEQGQGGLFLSLKSQHPVLWLVASFGR